MNSINYQALREAAQNYQSMLAWYEVIPDSPNAEVDCDEALAAFKRQIRHREVDIIADLLDELEAAKKRITELETREVALPAKKFCPAEHAGSLLWTETEVWNRAISACAVAIRAAGIRIKGENDAGIKE
ncbi:ead/Ea22-like family protein [Escherichia marmotae]|uniref:ead/Ea22-like family protein n=1 Tax=Escherichia TaxID=561 RepID=UPI001F4DF8FA|nr:ead/Ea22-like family protein [Escherichia marmotae]MED0362681.1 ead/Ea22-like family protein [Escherichia marmotae]MED8774702.1 ead/Ea22-like family protein [Escherichia marmotae]UNH35355.1 ead/Ea22-like family protein [Escherichia marmotae]